MDMREHINLASNLPTEVTVPQRENIIMEEKSTNREYGVDRMGTIVEANDERACLFYTIEGTDLICEWDEGMATPSAFRRIASIVESRADLSLFVFNGAPMLTTRQAMRCLTRFFESAS